MKTIILRWQETSDHEVRVSVPDDFHLDSDYADDIANDVASLDDDGFQYCERDSFEFEDVGNIDSAAEVLYEETGVLIDDR
ncbi:hypothetical protein F5X71_29605 [Nocardia brasiliensis]|uniref:Uncharacterized protein n=1 Tax=Nocardia brasiliensis TaxID=37326 RepID=A0A6G9XYG9_NOCBR|nr:hypothetical protein [Nocardia brasiliensis]QIS05910.1 hypothetical protein F5X71_29605 [Nocardia brasiliensis]